MPCGAGWSHQARPSGHALSSHAGPYQPAAQRHWKAPPAVSHQPRLLQATGEPGHLVMTVALAPVEGGGERLPQSSRGPAPPAPSEGKKPLRHTHCPALHVPRPLHGITSAVPSCTVVANSCGAWSSVSVPCPSCSSGALPTAGRKVTSVTPPGEQAAAAPCAKATPATMLGATAASTDCTLSPGAAPLPAGAAALSSAVVATAPASTSAAREPSAMLKAPALHAAPPQLQARLWISGAASASTSGSGAAGQRATEQSAPSKPASHAQPKTRSASQPA